jgi:Domain of unknown function (DUF4062)
MESYDCAIPLGWLSEGLLGSRAPKQRGHEHERQAVLRSILDLGHIPSGMELFSSADNEQFDYIKIVIDECDYYVLVIGGRYGSVDEAGISYTEKEYDYAFENGIPVLAFIHEDIKKIAFGRVDAAPDKAQKLQAFTDKVESSKNRLFLKANRRPVRLGDAGDRRCRGSRDFLTSMSG